MAFDWLQAGWIQWERDIFVFCLYVITCIIIRDVRMLCICACILFSFIMYRMALQPDEKALPAFAGTDEMASRLKNHVIMLSQTIGVRNVDNLSNLENTHTYIMEQLASFGYTPMVQEYEVDGTIVKNIVAIKKGTLYPNEVVVLGAHYDSCYNPGADDNASGIAGMLALAQVMSKKNIDRTIQFVAFTNEEPPYYKTYQMGSKVYVEQLKQKGEKVTGAIILEMIGYYSSEADSQHYPSFLRALYPKRGNFIGFISNIKSAALTKRSLAGFEQKTKFPAHSTYLGGIVPSLDNSDHWAFWREGIPALMVTDTAGYRNPNYHTQKDTYTTLDYSSMAEVVKGLEGTLEQLTSRADEGNSP